MRRLHNISISNDNLEDIELCTLLTTAVENLQAVSHFKHETFTALFSRLWDNYQGVAEESNKMSSQVFYSWKIPLSCLSDQHGVCKCQFYATSAFRRNQPRDWKCYERICGEVTSLEAKDSSGGNYEGQGRGFTTGRLHEATRFHQSGLVSQVRERFSASRAQQRQTSRLYRWSGSCWGANICRRIWHGLRRRPIRAHFRLDF